MAPTGHPFISPSPDKKSPHLHWFPCEPWAQTKKAPAWALAAIEKGKAKGLKGKTLKRTRSEKGTLCLEGSQTCGQALKLPKRNCSVASL
jgi:hypothetical protein